MADRYTATTSAQTLTVAATKAAETILQLGTSANARARVYGWTFTFDDETTGTATDKMVLCEVLRQTDAGTTGTGISEVPMDVDSPASQVTALEGLWATTEPSPGAVISAAYAHPNGGGWAVTLDEPIVINVSSYVGFRCTTSGAGTPDAAVTVVYEG